jgi:hypothetical protein
LLIVDDRLNEATRLSCVATRNGEQCNEPKPSYADILTWECGINNPKDSENVINKSRSSESVRPILLKEATRLSCVATRNGGGRDPGG